jgi:hypothetical protein
MSRGVLHSKRHEPGPAHADFGKAIEIEPRGGFDGYRVRGMAFVLKGDYRHAVGSRSIRTARLLTRFAEKPIYGTATTNMPLPKRARRSTSIRDPPTHTGSGE